MSNNNVSAAEALALVGLIDGDVIVNFRDERGRMLWRTNGNWCFCHDHGRGMAGSLTDALRALGVEVQPQADGVDSLRAELDALRMSRTVRVTAEDVQQMRDALALG